MQVIKSARRRNGIESRRGNGGSLEKRGGERLSAEFEVPIYRLNIDSIENTLGNTLFGERERKRDKEKEAFFSRQHVAQLVRRTYARASRKGPRGELSNSVYAFSYFPFCFASCSVSSINSLTPLSQLSARP